MLYETTMLRAFSYSFLATAFALTSAYSVTEEALSGAWVNGYGDYIIIQELDGQLFLEIKDHCYFAVITDQDGAIQITQILPEIFCEETPEGHSGTLDAVRAAFGQTSGFEIKDDLLEFTNAQGRILAGFDSVREAGAPQQEDAIQP